VRGDEDGGRAGGAPAARVMEGTGGQRRRAGPAC
jgi:hypothetical protein